MICLFIFTNKIHPSIQVVVGVVVVDVVGGVDVVEVVVGDVETK